MSPQDLADELRANAQPDSRIHFDAPSDAAYLWNLMCQAADLLEHKPFPVGVGVIVIYQGRVLLSQRLAGASHGVGWWSCPGGTLEGSDDGIVAGALRELREETKLVPILHGPDAPRVLMHVEEGKKSNRQAYLTSFVVCHIDDVSALANPEPHKHADWRWFHLAELPQHMWSRDIVADVLLGVA